MLRAASERDIIETCNQISVDGDTSTNGMVAILVNGLSRNPIIDMLGKDFDMLCAALRMVTITLCGGLVKDGNGASKMVESVVKRPPQFSRKMKFGLSWICTTA
jgi:glutamate N-acetyltransferase/amino-acid N-acetyltransferase